MNIEHANTNDLHSIKLLKVITVNFLKYRQIESRFVEQGSYFERYVIERITNITRIRFLSMIKDINPKKVFEKIKSRPRLDWSYKTTV